MIYDFLILQPIHTLRIIYLYKKKKNEEKKIMKKN